MLTPDQHYQEADRILASLSDLDPTAPFPRVQVARAHVHAVLASCGYIDDFEDDVSASRNGYVAPREEVVAKVTGDRL